MSVMVDENAEIIPLSQQNFFRVLNTPDAEYIPRMSTDFQLRLRQLMASRNLSAQKLSVQAGLSREAVRKMLEPDAGLPRGGSITKLARTLGISEQQLLTGQELEATVQPAEHARFNELLQVDIKAVVAGSVEGAFQIHDNAIGQAPLPNGLKHATNVYAIIVVNDSMVPEHRPGEIRYVTPDIKPRLGDSVVIEFERDPERGPEAMIGHLIQNGQTIKIGKLNPPAEIIIDSSEKRRLDRIATYSETLGGR